MDDELDSLIASIEEPADAGAAAAAAEPDDDASLQEEVAAGEEAAPDAERVAGAHAVDDEGEGEEGAPPPEVDEVAELRRQLAERDAREAQLRAWLEEQRRLAAQQAQAEEVKRFVASLEEMVPEDRLNAVLPFLYRQIAPVLEENQRLKAEQQRAAEREKEHQAKQEFVNRLKAGGRPQPAPGGGWVWTTDAKRALTDAEVAVLAEDYDDPERMLRRADWFVENRKRMTAAARRAKAEEARARGVETPPLTGRGATPPTAPEPTTLDELIDSIFP